MAFKRSKIPVLPVGNQRSDELLEVDQAVWAAWEERLDPEINPDGTPSTYEETIPRYVTEEKDGEIVAVDKLAVLRRMLDSAAMYHTRVHDATGGAAGARIRVKVVTRRAKAEDLDDLDGVPADADPDDYVTVAFTPVTRGERPSMRGPRGPRNTDIDDESEDESDEYDEEEEVNA